MTQGAALSPVEFPYLFHDYDRHGRMRWFVRLPAVPGKKLRRKVRIRAAKGTEEFTKEYWAARNGPTEAAPKITKALPGSFRVLAEHYRASKAFRSLDRRLTQRPRELILEKLVEQVGDLAAIIPPATIRAGVRARGYGAAKDFLSCLRAVYRVAIEDELVGTDPTVGISAPRPKVEGHHTWTPAECAAFEERWPIGTKPRTAYAIGIFTGQRISDACKLGRPHAKDGRLRFTQQKNRKSAPVDVDIPIVDALQAALDGWRGKGLTWLETEYGQPFTPDGLSNAFRKWCDKAGLEHCSFHGLRKACGTRLAEAGATPHQIMAVLGHQTHQQAAVYTRKAERAGMADDAMGKGFGWVQPDRNPQQSLAEGRGPKSA